MRRMSVASGENCLSSLWHGCICHTSRSTWMTMICSSPTQCRPCLMTWTSSNITSSLAELYLSEITKKQASLYDAMEVEVPTWI